MRPLRQGQSLGPACSTFDYRLLVMLQALHAVDLDQMVANTDTSALDKV
jgi:hypothetical protein